MKKLLEKMDGETRKKYERGELSMADLKENGLIPAYDSEEGEYDQEESELNQDPSDDDWLICIKV